MSQSRKIVHEDELKRAQVLTEALPWITKMSKKTIVVKYGGSAMEDPDLRRHVISDLALMHLIGIRLVIVHGGGKAISSLMKSLDLPVSFVNGMRVTDDAAMKAVQMALLGDVNQELVRTLNEYGNIAVGVSGTDANTLKATRISEELGRVGTVCAVDTRLIETLLDAGYVPVVGGVATDDAGTVNVNADLVASELAKSMRADKLIYLTDVDGLYRDFSDKDSLISRLTLDEAKELMTSGALESGMIPKIRAATEALDAGVGRVHILNGTFPHAMLLEIFTDSGIGTMIFGAGEAQAN